jgi:predicted enzyme related to lactoylglutathione lyase
MNKFISWVEIPVTDMQRAIQFYNTVFKLDLQLLDSGEEKMACFPNSEGALSYAKGFKPSKDGALVSLNTKEDLEQTIERILMEGGEVVQPITKIEAEDRGYFAIFIDSEGKQSGFIW